MSYPDRLISSITFISSRNSKDIEGQRVKSGLAFLIYFILTVFNVLVVALITKNIIAELPIAVSIFIMFAFWVCPMFLAWPIVATSLVRAKLDHIPKNQ